METAFKPELTCDAADTGVILATSITPSNTKLISISETHTYTCTYTFIHVCAQIYTYKNVHMHIVTVNIRVENMTHTQRRPHKRTLNEE